MIRSALLSRPVVFPYSINNFNAFFFNASLVDFERVANNIGDLALSWLPAPAAVSNHISRGPRFSAIRCLTRQKIASNFSTVMPNVGAPSNPMRGYLAAQLTRQWFHTSVAPVSKQAAGISKQAPWLHRAPALIQHNDAQQARTRD